MDLTKWLGPKFDAITFLAGWNEQKFNLPDVVVYPIFVYAVLLQNKGHEIGDEAFRRNVHGAHPKPLE